jgi:hypothetical protein
MSDPGPTTSHVIGRVGFVHGGPLLTLRQLLVYARPWQQVLVCLVLMAIGVAVLVTGGFVGIAPALFGLLLVVSIVRSREQNLRAPAGDAPDDQ